MHPRHHQSQILHARGLAFYHVHDLPFVDDGDPIGQIEYFIQILGDQQDCATFSALFDQPMMDIFGGAYIEATRNFPTLMAFTLLSLIA